MKIAAKRVCIPLWLVILAVSSQAPAQPMGDGYQYLDASQVPSANTTPVLPSDGYTAVSDVVAPNGQAAMPQWDQGAWEQGQAEYGLAPPSLESVGPCCAECGGGYACPDAWYWDYGTRVLNRSRTRRILLDQNYLGQQIFTTRSLGFDVAAGYQTTVGHYLGRDTENRDQFVEFTYWGMNEWHETRTADGLLLNFGTQQDPVFEGSLFSFFETVGGFDFAEAHQISYRSRIDNFELNARIRPRGRQDRLVLQPNGRWERRCQPGWYISYLAGLRGMSMDEDFTFHSSGRVITNQGTTFFFAHDAIRTHNDMFGFQVGAELIRRQCRLEYGVAAKAAPMINWSDQFTDVTTSGMASPLTRYARKDDLAFFGEVSAVGRYKLLPNLVAYASFDFMWLLGAALAPEQIDFTLAPTPKVNDNGHVFYQGMTLGLEATW